MLVQEHVLLKNALNGTKKTGSLRPIQAVTDVDIAVGSMSVAYTAKRSPLALSARDTNVDSMVVPSDTIVTPDDTLQTTLSPDAAHPEGVNSSTIPNLLDALVSLLQTETITSTASAL